MKPNETLVLVIEIRVPGGTAQNVSVATATTRQIGQDPPPPAQPQTVPTHGDFQLMTDPQRRMLFRLAAQRGVKPEEAQAWLEQYLKVPSLKQVSRAEASRAIDALQAKANGNGNGAHP